MASIFNSKVININDTELHGGTGLETLIIINKRDAVVVVSEELLFLTGQNTSRTF